MRNERMVRRCLFAGALLLMAGAIAFFSWRECNTCLGLSFRETEPAGSYAYRDYSDQLLFLDERAAVDVKKDTLYIPQSIGTDTSAWALHGKLTLRDGGQKMYFLRDAAFENLAEAVAQNHRFQLIIESGKTYMRYQVVFTTLPVLCMEENEGLELTEKGDIAEGTLRVWTPSDGDAGGYSVKKSNLQWHLRGNYTMGQPKKSIKLCLKKKNGTPKNLALLGMGADDDWILNPMSLDDTKLKEKYLMTLWNELADGTPWDERMSTGAHVEVLINGTYRGVYLLQRRVDKKYLSLDSSQILLKASGDEDEMEPRACKIVYSPFDETQTYAIWSDMVAQKLVPWLDIPNLIDVNLFVQFGALYDNAQFRNLFYLLTPEADSYRVSLLLWDTDQAMGVVKGFRFNLNASAHAEISRMEYDFVRDTEPGLDEETARRWQALRQGILSQDRLEQVLDALSRSLAASGCLERDQEIWGQAYGGREGLETLRQYVAMRTEFLDAYYGIP